MEHIFNLDDIEPYNLIFKLPVKIKIIIFYIIIKFSIAIFLSTINICYFLLIIYIYNKLQS